MTNQTPETEQKAYILNVLLGYAHVRENELGEDKFVGDFDFNKATNLIDSYVKQEVLKGQIEVLQGLSVLPAIDNYTDEPNEIITKFGEAAGEYKWLHETIAELESQLTQKEKE